VLFGSDPLLGHGDPLRGKAALEALEFYTHVDIFPNPSAQFADLLLPAASCWEREALMPSFDIAEDTVNWLQLRPAVVPPVHGSKADAEIIFALATRLGLGENFFDGDIDAALDFQLAPAGFTVQGLRESPRGVRAHGETRYRKYAEVDTAKGKPRGFDTPTGRIEIFSVTFANAAYAPLPEFHDAREDLAQYPLTLTFFRDIHFCDEQHRNIARLRRAMPEPSLEIHPSAAEANGIAPGQWIWLETATGKVRLKAKFNHSLHPEVVATVYGWWQPCDDLQLAGYDPFRPDGANTNLLIPNIDNDPISASVAHRGQRCRVRR
jgi:anaerobic selenocysteine-containing dehydrogenase